MKIIIPSAGPVPDHRTADYIINIAKKLNTQLVVLQILSEKETEAEGEQSLGLFVKNGERENVPVNIIPRMHGKGATIRCEIQFLTWNARDKNGRTGADLL